MIGDGRSFPGTGLGTQRVVSFGGQKRRPTPTPKLTKFLLVVGSLRRDHVATLQLRHVAVTPRFPVLEAQNHF